MPPPASPAPDPDRSAGLRILGEQLPRLIRVVQALKAGTATEGRDRAAHVLLFPLVRVGPLRQGALADLVHADPSTISRHVAALVDGGLVERVPDERDGRASRLLVTEAGHAALASLRAEREAVLAEVTADWDEAELAAFTGAFARFVDGLSTALPTDPPTGAATDPREDR